MALPGAVEPPRVFPITPREKENVFLVLVYWCIGKLENDDSGVRSSGADVLRKLAHANGNIGEHASSAVSVLTKCLEESEPLQVRTSCFEVQASITARLEASSGFR